MTLPLLKQVPFLQHHTSNLNFLREQGWELKQDRKPFNRQVDITLDPFLSVPANYTSAKPSIIIVDNDETCVQRVLDEMARMPIFNNYQLIGLYFRPGTDPSKIISVAAKFGDLVIIDSGQYIDRNCPECNEATAMAAKLHSLDVEASTSVPDPREAMCPVGLLSTAMSMVA